MGSDRDSGDEAKAAPAQPRRFFFFGRRRREAARAAAKSPIDEEGYEAASELPAEPGLTKQASSRKMSASGIHVVPGFGAPGDDGVTSSEV